MSDLEFMGRLGGLRRIEKGAVLLWAETRGVDLPMQRIPDLFRRIPVEEVTDVVEPTCDAIDELLESLRLIEYVQEGHEIEMDGVGVGRYRECGCDNRKVGVRRPAQDHTR